MERMKYRSEMNVNVMPEKLNLVIGDMQNVFSSVPHGIDHTLNVLENAQQIIKAENPNWQTAVIIKLAAVLHDINAIEAQKKHGSMDGRFQELEGPAVASCIIKKYDYEQSVIDRVFFIVGNHHTPEKIDGIDFQILWEADLIENMQVMNVVKDAGLLKQFISDNFKTKSGKDRAHLQTPVFRHRALIVGIEKKEYQEHP
jgi:HD superfamily phosphohydrolase YqeK